jgi:hypothetical protein
MSIYEIITLIISALGLIIGGWAHMRISNSYVDKSITKLNQKGKYNQQAGGDIK